MKPVMPKLTTPLAAAADALRPCPFPFAAPRRGNRVWMLAGLLMAISGLAACAGEESRAMLEPLPLSKREAATASPPPAMPSVPPTAERALPRPTTAHSPARRHAPDTILVAGQPVRIGTRVVLYNEPGGLNAYQTPAFFGPRVDRFHNGQPDLPGHQAQAFTDNGYTLAELQKVVDRFVIHYDVAGTARRCFDVLRDRGLSVHFLLDLDGTIYQTLDLQERAWHASESNTRSVGIEIANIGAYSPDNSAPFDRWYRTNERGQTQLIAPAAAEFLRPAAAAGPARPQPVYGRIHGRWLMQYDLTDAQYDALIHLTAGLTRAFPLLRPDAPRDAHGNVTTDLLSDADMLAFRGILGHYHLTTDKIDPGPAFDWPRLLDGVRRELGHPH